MKTMNLAMVAMLAMGTALTTLGKPKSTYASLTAPTVYDYSYTWNATDSEQYLNVNGVDSIPLYTRTADGIYFNYTTTFNVIDGLTITQTFNRSNTAWQASGTFYKPDEDKIGSDSTVGNIPNKIYLKFDNQTNKDYHLHFDRSSSGNNEFFRLRYNDLTFYGFLQENYLAHSILNRYYIPAYYSFEISLNPKSNSQYLDAWYLQNLGVSNAYQEGYDANRVGILTDYLGTDAQQIGWVLLGIAAIIFVFKGGK
jgi:hypothetical protein